MKYRFVKKGTEISSDKVNSLMNFGQVMDKAAGMSMGAAPLSKAALGMKTVSLTKVIAIVAIPVSTVIYLAADKIMNDSPEPSTEQSLTVELPEDSELLVADSLQNEKIQRAEDTAEVEAQTEKPNKVAVANPKPANRPVKPATASTKSDDYQLSKEDVMIRAEPIGGFRAFYDQIDRELTYPESKKFQQIEGYVHVHFVVDKEGKPGKFEVVHSLGEVFDEEALRVMAKTPDWVPATHNGQPVSSHMSIRLRFKLEEKE